MNHADLIQKVIEFDHGDPRRIQHFLKVHEFAALIGHLEGLPADTQFTLEAASILHDIGIHDAEKFYGSSAGKYQELTGPAPAREILGKLHYAEKTIERVCWLIAHHHTYDDVAGIDYQILLEADFLVNSYEDTLSPEAIRSFRDKIFRTQSGLHLLNVIYDSG
jgi:uncharacterized protein